MSKRFAISSVFILGAIALLATIYFTPVWWVSLTAPNYPEEAFPDGVRIHFHMNGVFNGCKKVEKAEIQEEEALDCVHEMDTINHYVGMYPIAAGGVVERAFSQYLVALLGVMLLGFLCRKPKARMVIMSVGFGAIVVWMSLGWFGKDGLMYQNSGYIKALVLAMDQDTSKDKKTESSSMANEWLADFRKRAGFEEPKKAEAPKHGTEDSSNEKADNIELLRVTFQKDQERKPEAEREEWTGSSSQMMRWHYEKNLGRYFNNPAEIQPLVKTMSAAATIVFFGIIGAMVLLVWGARKNSGILYWLLIVVPMALPLFFLVEYSAWLWWYGHRLNDMGAFTVKPFMPTVFGQGKVAQFTTHSYPYIGFFMMLGMSVLLALAALLRLKIDKEEG